MHDTATHRTNITVLSQSPLDRLSSCPLFFTGSPQCLSSYNDTLHSHALSKTVPFSYHTAICAKLIYFIRYRLKCKPSNYNKSRVRLKCMITSFAEWPLWLNFPRRHSSRYEGQITSGRSYVYIKQSNNPKNNWKGHLRTRHKRKNSKAAK